MQLTLNLKCHKLLIRTASYFELETKCVYHLYLAVPPLVSVHISIRGGMSKNTSASGLPLS